MKKAALGPRGGMNGYRAGASKEGRPPVGFDKAAEMRALGPHCKRCAYNGDGDKYRPWRDCPHGGAQAKHTGTAAAFCCPLDGEDAQAMALAQVFQDAADCGPVAFAAAIEVHGAPAVLTAGGAAAELDMSAYGFSVPAEGQAGMRDLPSARLDDASCRRRVSPSTVRPFSTMGLTEHAPAAAAAVTVGVQCERAFDGLTFSYEGSTGGGTCGVVTIATAPPMERTPWPRTIECAAPHELTAHELAAQHGAGFQVAAGAFTASQISVPPVEEQHVAQTARRPAVGCGVPTLGFGIHAGDGSCGDAFPALHFFCRCCRFSFHGCCRVCGFIGCEVAFASWCSRLGDSVIFLYE
ncbi:hypothetical protein CYMTET_46097 [Cymbomonas tetramitiformis]|uniref:Uncharacterized protein n=1 Tax=Cymbomonas tetramitiformis TaxID=36881 RepID=A0AAE0BYW4_9CHLO|nr:hypothetical protein CYMTET_46097 [Cymbomonas tetramitiformis]